MRNFHQGSFRSDQSLSRVRLFATPWTACSTPGLPVHHQLWELIQTHVHRVGDAIQPSHPLSSHFPPAPNPSQHQSFISPQMPHGNHLWRHWSIVDFVEKLLTMTLIYLIDVGLFRLCISSWMDFNSLYILKSFSFPPRHKLYWHNIFVILFIMFLILKNLY